MKMLGPVALLEAPGELATLIRKINAWSGKGMRSKGRRCWEVTYIREGSCSLIWRTSERLGSLSSCLWESGGGQQREAEHWESMMSSLVGIYSFWVAT